MKLNSFCILLLLLLLGAGKASAQNAFGDLTSFETDKVMKKVIVCIEDQSVWALSDAGKVYYKPGGAAAFSPFVATANIQVKDLAGYNANEMYFLTATDQLHQSKNMGALIEIVVPGSQPQPLNGIAVVHASRNNYLEGYHGKRDWLAIATSRIVYSFFRNNETFASFTPVSTGSTPNVRITNSGYKSLDFQYNTRPTEQCFGNQTNSYFNKVGAVTTETVLPDAAPVYDGNVNCTYFEAPFNQEKDGGRKGFEYWGTDKGLFVKRSGSCDLADVGKILSVKVNDLEELNFFRDIFNYRMILAAGADGLYVGNSVTVNTSANGPVGNAELTKLNLINVGVNSIASEIHGFNAAVNGEGTGLCQTAVWLATEEGVIRLTINPSAVSIDKNTFGSYGELVSVSAGLKEYYCVSNGEEYRFTVNLPNNDAVNYTVQWLWNRQNYSERTELPGTAGINPKIFNEGGEYGVRITSACGERIDIGDFWLRDPEPVTVDFNYDPVVHMFSGCTFTFRAKSGNKYKWEKDGVILEGETSNVLVAREPGIYRLLYEDYCISGYTPVEPVKLEEIELPAPVVTRSKTQSLCFGKKVILSVDDPGVEGIGFRWKKNGVAIPGATSQTLEVDLPGNYSVDFVGDDPACYRPSATQVVTVNEQLNLEVPPQIQICTITNQQLKLTAHDGFVKYTWDGVVGTNNYLDVTAPGEYMLEVEDASGCTASTSYIVVPYCPPPVPSNAFSPNGDGSHDTWTVTELNNDPLAILRIYNRYGVLIFTGTKGKPAWDGRFRGADSPVGTYYYVVMQKKSSKVLTGSLTLIR